MNAAINGADLTSRAMLVDLRISYWRARKQDKKATGDAIKANNAQTTAGKFHKYLIDPDAPEYVAVKNAEGDIRSWHYLNTLPWTNAVRCLPSANFIDYTDGLRKRRMVFDEKVATFVATASTLREQAKAILGDMYNDAEYPDENLLRGKFGVNVDIYPLPAAGDFRVKLADDEVEVIRAQISATVHEATGVAMTDCWERLHGVVKKMSERLTDPDATFRDSLVGNIEELCDLLPRLNVAGDAQLDDMAKTVRGSLCKHDPESLREDKTLRADVASRADALLKKMNSYIGPSS